MITEAMTTTITNHHEEEEVEVEVEEEEVEEEEVEEEEVEEEEVVSFLDLISPNISQESIPTRPQKRSAQDERPQY